MDAKKKTLYMIGNAHIDPVWFWNWQEGLQEIKATFRSALDRMKEYPEFIFTCSSAAFHEWIEKNEPEMFEEIRARVREGRWVLVGGWWMEPDCNAPCGESYARHALYGQRYFEEKFGVHARTGYNIDSFGHNGMLPQILKKSGLDAYVFMRPGRHEKAIPADTFLWRSKDGSALPAFRISYEYCTWPEEIGLHVRRCADALKNEGDAAMCFYGVGNHGGGPTKKNLDSIAEMDKNPELPRLRLDSPDGYFDAVKKNAAALPVLEGEMYHHASGCYSAQSEVKTLNRRAENRLLAAEKLSAGVGMLLGRAVPQERFAQAWRRVLFNQFHDTMAGSSIPSAYDDAREAYGYALQIAAEESNTAAQALSWRIRIPMDENEKPIVVFNPNAFAGRFPVELQCQVSLEDTALLDDTGRQIPFQSVRPEGCGLGRGRICFVAELPALGWRTYRLVKMEKAKCFPPVSCTDTTAENAWFRVEFDAETGFIRSLVKKQGECGLFCGPAAQPVVIRDTSDTWSHGVRRFDEVVGEFRAVSVRRVEHGPVCSVIRVTSEYGSSRLIQDFTIYAELDFMAVNARLDWHEKLAMLKLRFPMNLQYFRGSYEIPYGYAGREPDGEEYPMQTWADFEGAVPGNGTVRAGLSILNDALFACSAEGKTVGLTVVRSPAYAHHEPYELLAGEEYEYVDQGERRFTYALYPHGGTWEESGTVRRAAALNQKAFALFETYHDGPLEQSGSLLECTAENVLVTVLKKAEDGNGWIIRACETAGVRAEAELVLPQSGARHRALFQPYEIKTLHLPENEGEAVEAAIPEYKAMP